MDPDEAMEHDDPSPAATRPAAEREAPPRYVQLRHELQARIARGEYGVGTNLPTEAELCQAFGASRHTVREALRGLVELGLIERRQGAGSVVVAPATPRVFGQSVKSLSELWSYTRATKIIVLSSTSVALDADEAAVVGAPADSRWLKIGAERWIADESEIVCSLTLYAHMRFAPVLASLGQSTDPVYAILEAATGEKVAEAVQEISACAMPREAAARLHRRKGEPALRIVRRYLDASGSPMLVAVSIHPGDSFTHTLRLKRENERT
jgi:DNA-binding GntR family transcriptional regulator